MIRKNIKENEGQEIAKNLINNKNLEKIELEGNSIGPKTAHEIGELIKNNNILRFIDLENNNLTNSGQDINGIKNIAEALKTNSTLLNLNMNSTHLDKKSGEFLLEAMKSNTTLIMLDIEGNSKMDIEDVKAIQDILVKNR